MALNLDAVGKKIGPMTKEYIWKDTVLYALGVGAGFEDLEYCYEKDLKVIPSFAIVTMYEFMPQLMQASNMNLAGILHGEQELIFHQPIPTDGTLSTQGTLTHYYDKGKDKGALVISKSETFHSNGQKLYTSIGTVLRVWMAVSVVKMRPQKRCLSRSVSPILWSQPSLLKINRFFSGSPAIFSSCMWMPNSPRWPDLKSRSCTAFARTVLPAGP